MFVFTFVPTQDGQLLAYPHRLVHLQAFGQGVCDEQHGHFAFELVDGAGEVFCGVRVEVAGGFVEDQDFRPLEQGAGDGEALLLSAREAHAALADFGLVALGEFFDGVVDFRHAAGLHDLVEGGVGVGHQQVVVDRAGEQHGFLRHDAEVAA